ncbi:hypothetical protein SDC9_168196 [bioreactor metagenome]|uniref:Uncharacterized protein n=1 Tax=bioreactor metagenome TaxID=1076179 RepID=A0A645G1V3_9ZZZZ
MRHIKGLSVRVLLDREGVVAQAPGPAAQAAGLDPGAFQYALGVHHILHILMPLQGEHQQRQADRAEIQLHHLRQDARIRQEDERARTGQDIFQRQHDSDQQRQGNQRQAECLAQLDRVAQGHAVIRPDEAGGGAGQAFAAAFAHIVHVLLLALGAVIDQHGPSLKT